MTTKDTASPAATGDNPQPADEDADAIWQSLDDAEAAQARAQSGADPELDPQSSDTPQSPPAAPQTEPKADGAKAPPADAKPAPQPQSDPFAGVTDEQIRSHPEYRRLALTVNGYQKQIDDLRAQVGKKDAPAPAADAPQQGQQTDKPAPGAKPDAKGLFEGQAFKDAKENYPDVIEPLEQILRGQTEAIQRLEQNLTGLSEDQKKAYYLRQEEVLESLQVGWKQTAASQDFQAWIATQPAFVRDTVQRNGQHIADAGEVASVFDYYKQARAKGTPTPTPAEGGDNNPPSPPPPPPPGSQLSGTRAAQLESSQGPRAKGGAPVATGIPEEGDPEAIWKAFDEEEARNAAAQGHR